MEDSRKKRERETSREVYGEVLKNGIVVECCYEAEDGKLFFLVSRPGEELRRVDNYTRQGQDIRLPYSNLEAISSGAIILPSGTEDYVSVEKLASDLEGFLAKYIDSDPYNLKLMAHYALATWVYDRWDSFPYLRFKGEPGSGKTRCLEVMKEICYRAIDLGVSPTTSALFRSVDQVRGTLIIDEADYDGDLRSELVKLLNAGYKTNGIHSISSFEQEKWVPRYCKVGGPKILANREAFVDRALETRALTVHTILKRPAEHIPTKLPKDFYKEAEVLRRKLLNFRFCTVRQPAAEEPSLRELDGRAREMCIAIYSIACDEQFKKDLLSYMRERTRTLGMEDPARIVFEALQKAAKPSEDKVLLQKVVNEARGIAQARELRESPFTPKRTSELVRALGFRATRWGKGVTVFLDRVVVEELQRRYAIEQDENSGE